MYTHIGLGIIALAAIMVIPISENSVDESKIYGYVTLAVHDVTGNTLFEQIIHNQLLDTGENFMLGQTFSNGTLPIGTDANLIDTICVSVDASFTANLLDTLDTVAFNANAAATDNNCRAASTNGPEAVVILNDAATISTQTFNATGTPKNIAADAIITGIGICSNEAATQADDSFQDCTETAGDAPLIAAVDTADVTLGASDTVDITYTLTLE